MATCDIWQKDGFLDHTSNFLFGATSNVGSPIEDAVRRNETDCCKAEMSGILIGPQT